MKINFDSDDTLPLSKTLKPYVMIAVVKPVLHEGHKH